MKKIIFLILFLLIGINAHALTRCEQYRTEVRRNYYFYFGLNYPYWYAMAQLRQESACRANVTAFDGGMGIAQFMPATQKDVEKGVGKFNPYNASEAIKANAYYMHRLHKSNWDGRLWLTYMFYNSGYGNVRKEFLRTGEKKADYDKMRKICKRRVITLKSGNLLNLCDVGYDYPKQIYKFGKSYKTFEDKMDFW